MPHTNMTSAFINADTVHDLAPYVDAGLITVDEAVRITLRMQPYQMIEDLQEEVQQREAARKQEK